MKWYERISSSPHIWIYSRRSASHSDPLAHLSISITTVLAQLARHTFLIFVHWNTSHINPLADLRYKFTGTPSPSVSYFLWFIFILVVVKGDSSEIEIENKTSAPIEAWKCNFLAFENIVTDQPNNQPTYRPGSQQPTTDEHGGHGKVTQIFFFYPYLLLHRHVDIILRYDMCVKTVNLCSW